MSFVVPFLYHAFAYSATMPKLNVIYCKANGSTSVFLFVPSMANKSTMAGSMSLFEDLNINQLGLETNTLR